MSRLAYDGADFQPPSIRFITPLIKATTSFPPLVYDEANSERLLHEQAILCARLARLLRRSLRGLEWEELHFGDRSRLERALSGLGSDIPLVWLIEGQEHVEGPPALAQNKPTLAQNKKALSRPRRRSRGEELKRARSLGKEALKEA